MDRTKDVTWFFYYLGYSRIGFCFILEPSKHLFLKQTGTTPSVRTIETKMRVYTLYGGRLEQYSRVIGRLRFFKKTKEIESLS